MASLKIGLKRTVARALGNRYVFAASAGVFKVLQFPFIRIVAYHDTPLRLAPNLETHLRWYARNFVNCDQAALEQFLSDGTWPHTKPGLIISFDDGLRSNALVAAPLLESFGFTGWFMVPVMVPELDPPNDRKFADEALIPYADENRDERIFVSWDDLRALTMRGHEICSHGFKHKRLGASLTSSELAEEIARSKMALEDQLGREVSCFAWVGGEEYSFSKAALSEMRRAGYRRIFSTNCFPVLRGNSPLCLERNHVDAKFDLNELRLSVGGFYDIFYQRKRRRISRVIGLENT